MPLKTGDEKIQLIDEDLLSHSPQKSVPFDVNRYIKWPFVLWFGIYIFCLPVCVHTFCGLMECDKELKGGLQCLWCQ